MPPPSELADGTPETPGVYVVTCPHYPTRYCTTLEAAMRVSKGMAHIDAGPLYPFIDAEVHRDGRLVYVYDCYERTGRLVADTDEQAAGATQNRT